MEVTGGCIYQYASFLCIQKKKDCACAFLFHKNLQQCTVKKNYRNNMKLTNIILYNHSMCTYQIIKYSCSNCISYQFFSIFELKYEYQLLLEHCKPYKCTNHVITTILLYPEILPPCRAYILTRTLTWQPKNQNLKLNKSMLTISWTCT